MPGGRVTIDTINGFEWFLFKILPRRKYIEWRIKSSPLLANALASRVEISVQLPGGEDWMIRCDGKVERA